MTLIEIEPLKKKSDLRDDQSHKIVQTDAGKRTETPAPDAFLGEHTQTVDRQTVSKNRLTQTGGKTQTQAHKHSEASKSQIKSAASPDVTVVANHDGALSKFGVAILPPLGSKQKQNEQAEQSDSPLSAATAQDYVKGFKESEKTALNTKEYIFYGYFQRIRQRLDWAWDKSLRAQLHKIYKRGRQLASDMDHTTRIMVTLNQAGEVVAVQIVEESGTHDLDDAAIRAFNEAGPFPNPPKGIVDAQGKIQIRWDFVLKT
ncbi:MAG: energy transducer TonB [Methylotenera sp.]|nr:energy transducer TonB [Oligoflexia bacterium]